ncbi:class I SAM-dependent methyltransferase [Lentzea sp. CA-135723]|uniref:class I SAM-dependent methyltransferase n=1 Tax=Lentzea sp. CA-135723 TaxID=3239950 RepID=UPI003D93156F
MTLTTCEARGRVGFLQEFVRAPFDVGAIAPSGRLLSNHVALPVPEAGDPLVVEIGPGTGAFTAAIEQRLAGRGTHVAVEINDRFARMLNTRYPNVDVVTADAGDLEQLLLARGHPRADIIVSGLPWTAFAAARQEAVLDGAVAGLAPDGTFTTFGYAHMRWTPPARRFRRLLDSRFEEVVTGRTIWANAPPAFVYYCRRPRPSR